MQIQIQTSDLETPTGWREQVEKRVRFVLRRLRHGIRHARVSLRDVNGPRGGVDKECRVTLKRDGEGEVVVRIQARTAQNALIAALHQAARRLVRSQQRQRGSRRAQRALPGESLADEALATA
ncbi:HPF/RaiA family ribosome-associated protein [Azonexus sp. R2A61]|uniref:HPF/RaiA family ribosome-associated protein n=1 Tax=Azonexus sp. R2A61 TaxID=2744443 RepID=UPI001F2180A9|nr:HPF/RaiA family ribosome-associated protein [Azonexus sp. R2A61]